MQVAMVEAERAEAERAAVAKEEALATAEGVPEAWGTVVPAREEGS